ncbi:MAG: hypothetical protein IJZ87_02010 [Bacteroidales bacterium]|nr:hypothetical protein [Bacteroidales bacterium]
MKRLLFILLLLLLSFVMIAQDVDFIQIPNSDFELWNNIGTKNEEPHAWHSFKSSTGPFSYLLMQQIERHTATRPGSNGNYSVHIFSRSIVGITANGNVTNGRLNAGSMFPAGAKNNNYTQRDSEFCTEINRVPDSLTVWVCLRTKKEESYGRIMSYVHADADFVCLTGGWEPYEMLCAQVEFEFPRTASTEEEMNWIRLGLPFKDYSHLCKEARYILTSFTTNRRAGEGNAGDEMFIDDLHLIYNPTLEVVIRNEELGVKSCIDVQYYIEGTMSTPNLNIPSNEVIVKVSSNENFKNPIEIGRVVSDKSGNIKCYLPDEFVNKKCYVKVFTTNYPMESRTFIIH